ncbi:MAG: 2-nitropropane dioxygenase [Deltaproteobacteria bacterium HGW-Deltaproteobacteria-23]|nr:MAG: 2-nitropropane dioxygenase [Deltaproteobacteria bacterium HGW-Deltaproteobacteria-23]
MFFNRSDFAEQRAQWCQQTNHSPETLLKVAKGLRCIDKPLFLTSMDGAVAVNSGETGTACPTAAEIGSSLVIALATPLLPQNLGNPDFCGELGIRYPYLGGSMAKGISSVRMGEELGNAGMLGFFGAAGLPLSEVEAAADRLKSSLGSKPFGCNLIHSPHEPDLEEELVSLYIKKGICLIEASAFLALTLTLVRYRLHGICRLPDGTIHAPNRIIAKVSREELAARFFSPPPEKLIKELLSRGEISEEQAALAEKIPMAQYVTAEADSGGHTDNRPAIVLFPTIKSLAERLEKEFAYDCRLTVGLGGGISTPASAAAAFAMGADYIMTGSVNQGCIESGTSAIVREMLTETRQADVTMAPAADMFEMGVTVQVLKRGTMFPMRAAKLYELYRNHASLEDIPAQEREKLEKTLFLAPLADIWKDTRAFFQKRDPKQVERAERDPKHLMSLVFRWYLGQAAHWAKDGNPSRKMDYQIWVGPAMGAFNEWVAGSFLAEADQRKVVTVARNILYGAAVLSRATMLRSQGVRLPAEAVKNIPLQDSELKEYF